MSIMVKIFYRLVLLVSAGLVSEALTLSHIAFAQMTQGQYLDDKRSLNDRAAAIVVDELDAITRKAAKLRNIRSRELRALEAQIFQKINDQATTSELAKKTLNDKKLLDLAISRLSAKITTTEMKHLNLGRLIAKLEQRKVKLLKQLAIDRGYLARTITAIQRISINQPITLINSSDSTIDAVRASSLFEAVLSTMRTQMAKRHQNLNELKKLRAANSDNYRKMKEQIGELAVKRHQIKGLIKQAQTELNKVQQNSQTQQKEINSITAKARNLQQLIAEIDRSTISEINQPLTKLGLSQGRDASAILADDDTEINSLEGGGDKSRGQQKAILGLNPNMAFLLEPAFSDQNRTKPSLTFNRSKGLLPMPAVGVKIQRFGQKNRFGSKSKGISLSVNSGSQVISPSDGWVVYAKAFRSYGKVLIIDVSSGYHILLAGLGQITARVGQFIRIGEPIAFMPSNPTNKKVVSAASDSLTNTLDFAENKLPLMGSEAVLYIELRKDGSSIDSSPWWAENN